MLDHALADPAAPAGDEDHPVLRARIDGPIFDVAFHGRFLVRVAGEFGAAVADEAVEITALVGLEHVIDVETLIAALHGGRRRFPALAATLQLLLVDLEMQA